MKKIFLQFSQLTFLFLLITNTICKSITQKNTILTMNQAIKMAHKHRPALKALKFATQAYKYDEKKAMAGYFPQLRLIEQPYFSTYAKGLRNNIKLSGSQLIYSFAGPIQSRRIARKTTEISKLTEEQQEDLVRFDVETAFLQSWLLQRKNRKIESLNQSSLETIKKAENQKKVDLLGKNDWLIQASAFAQNQSTVHLFPDELSNAQSQLEYLIGKKFDDKAETITLQWDSKKKTPFRPIDFYYHKALKNRKEIKSKQKEIEQYHEYQNFYKKTYLPSINLSGDVGRNSGITISAVGIALNWQLSDGGTNFHESNKANANKLKAIMEKDETIKLVKYEVEAAYYELSQLLKQLVAQYITLSQAKNEFDLKKLQFKIGDISKVDFETSKYNWENQEFVWLTLKINTTIKERQLIYACGYPQEL